MPSYQPKVRIKNVDICRVCKKKTNAKDLLIDGIDGNNYSITKQACENPICRDCLKKK